MHSLPSPLLLWVFPLASPLSCAPGARPGAPLQRHLRTAPAAEQAVGNVTALDSLLAAAEGVECIIHMAALVQAWARDPHDFDKVLYLLIISLFLFVFFQVIRPPLMGSVLQTL